MNGKTLLVAGGAGFIGSNFVRMAAAKYEDSRIIVLDSLTYAGNIDNLSDVFAEYSDRVAFAQGDIRSKETVRSVMTNADIVINFAAESSVDRSVIEPDRFVTTDVVGVYILLDAALQKGVECFLQISTDEVYGSVETGKSKEHDPLDPRSPYAASKAGGELLARSYFYTYGMPVIVSRMCNNFGPFQYPEKIIPYFLTNALDDKPLPIYGDGNQRRDYLFVEDCCRALFTLLEKGKPGETYNIGGGNERTTLQIAEAIVTATGKTESLILRVADRPGHDRRYCVDDSKIRDLGWKPLVNFEEAFAKTVNWYISNEEWWRRIRNSKPFKDFEERWFLPRIREAGWK